VQHRTKIIQQCRGKSTSTLMYLRCEQRQTYYRATQRLHSNFVEARADAKMERFPCHGKGKLVFNHHSRQVSLQISHQCCHPPYMNTSIPEKWARYIMERRDWNPATVSVFDLDVVSI
jgi:hypothetical protein